MDPTMVLPVNFDQYMAALDLIRRLQSTVRDQSTELDQLRRQSGGSNGHQLLDQITQLQRDLVAANAQVDQLTQKNSQLTVELEAAKTDINRLKAARIQPEPATPESSRSEPRTTQKSHINIVFPSVSSSASASSFQNRPAINIPNIPTIQNRSEQSSYVGIGTNSSRRGSGSERGPTPPSTTSATVASGYACMAPKCRIVFEDRDKLRLHWDQFHSNPATTPNPRDAPDSLLEPQPWTLLLQKRGVQWSNCSYAYRFLKTATKDFKALHNLPAYGTYLCRIPHNLVDEYIVHMGPSVKKARDSWVKSQSQKASQKRVHENEEDADDDEFKGNSDSESNSDSNNEDDDKNDALIDNGCSSRNGSVSNERTRRQSMNKKSRIEGISNFNQ
ncbi:hypothetical protein HDU99_003458, partial [Rhizoclosmatium hyalinum]